MKSKVIVALDFPDKDEALSLLAQLDPCLCRVKIGMQLFTLYGPALVRKIIDLGFDVFLDLKFHDIPQTVANAVKVACDLGVWMLTVHVQGGVEMLKAAREAIDHCPGRSPLLLGVTWLTSLDRHDLLLTTGRQSTTEDYVCDLARLAYQCQLDGVICSAQEARQVRLCTNEDFLLVTPGIRLSDVSHDQKRVVTPQQAVQNGADFLVVGRAITQSESPAEVVQRLIQL